MKAFFLEEVVLNWLCQDGWDWKGGLDAPSICEDFPSVVSSAIVPGTQCVLVCIFDRDTLA